MQDYLVLLGAEVPSGRAIAKKLRGEQYACRLLPSGTSPAAVRGLDPRGLVIAGEAGEGAAAPDAAFLQMGIPVLALGASARALLDAIGKVARTDALTETVAPVMYEPCALFAGVKTGERWIERANSYLVEAPMRVLAEGEGVPLAFGDVERGLYLLQFQMERNDPDGLEMLRAFSADICGCTPWWTVDRIIEDARQQIAARAGDREAICAISGGLDSTVAAMLAKQALGDRMQCVFVDTGLLRAGEADQTEDMFSSALGLAVRRVDVSARMMDALKGVASMDEKWNRIGCEITAALAAVAHEAGQDRVIIRGTNYADALEPGNRPELSCDMEAVEPLRDLFKDEVRMMGEQLGLPEEMLIRQPFPGMGLAARIDGEVTPERLRILRLADAIFSDEIALSGQDRRLSRYFAMLTRGRKEDTLVLRALHGTEPTMGVARLPFDLLERTEERIREEMPSVERVFYDLTPGMAEWPIA